ncbi:glycoside hydrolase family 85 protein [Dothidotthia symphoricarpi CBS 119687]|uniref:Glycoside hydrolase family 85 protein n=1 Tax=Dothidotthia symphoricarpi CBS 119687 TaxID=1392245 RepID=A0A6A6AD14_9PLEO|nr:glycoside hydrolase family 85 protein [Dothidotthia symphoricarpi CBS 119687]KAF2129153.1 glycoside hydrolase family 85 protein [Dothidotthia symphoricarpi CBS 119687]
MSMANILGWKDILRPIRDGYRHLFPSPDTGPTPEERRKQRELDRLRGFTYFDTFEQLESWTEADSDPLQRANTPLLQRSEDFAKSDRSKANVVLCHDYAGNYHAYEGVQGIGMDDEMYACEYLQYVDPFIYFSHKLICVPPPAWTNTLHRNGVKALGTILIEPQTEGSGRLLLQRAGDEVKPHFPLATKLANIAKHHGFDGWLVNIEKPFAKEDWDLHILQAFLRQLKGDLGHGKQLIWYDALTTSNKVSYQNALNASNLPFATACGSILTNYCWKETDAVSSFAQAMRHDAMHHGLSPQEVFCGIDVWAQNTTKLAHPRVTYPEKGGGGTNTGIAVAKLADLRLSACIFAPAWSYEHFPGHGRAIERAMWEGTALSANIDCPCGDCASRHPSNQLYPITRFARESAAGSKTFFYTDFNRAFGTHDEREKEMLFDGKNTHSRLGSQSVLPRTAVSKEDDESSRSVLSHRLEDLEGQSQLVIEVYASLSPTSHIINEQFLPLFHLNMPADGTLQLTVCYRKPSSPANVTTNFFVKSTSGLQIVPVPQIPGPHVVTATIGTQSDTRSTLKELGVSVHGPLSSSSSVRLVEILSICITPAHSVQATVTITGIHIEEREQGETQHLRLCWTYGSSSERAKGLPHSDITGPCSYFVVVVDGVKLGRAYALEHILPQRLVERCKGREVDVNVIGVGFDGQKLAEERVKVRM